MSTRYPGTARIYLPVAIIIKNHTWLYMIIFTTTVNDSQTARLLIPFAFFTRRHMASITTGAPPRPHRFMPASTVVLLHLLA